MAVQKIRAFNATFWLTQALLISACVVGLSALMFQQRALRMVAHTHEVLQHLEGVLVRLADAETGQRGFLLTGDPKLLAPYEHAVAGMRGEVDDLASLVSDNRTQLANVTAMRPRIDERLAIIARTVEVGRSGDMTTALSIIRGGRGPRLMDTIRMDVDRMREIEERLLAERNAHAQSLGQWGRLAVMALGVLALVLIWQLRRAAIRERASIEARIDDEIQAREKIRAANAQLEQRVEQRTHALQEANSELQAFAHSVAHDLRAPLRNIQGYATAILEDEQDRLSEDGALYARRMSESAVRLDGLIQDLLAYSALSRAEIELETVDLGRLVKRVQADLASEISLREAQIFVDTPLPSVVGHRPTLGQVLANLFMNALKFVSPEVTPEVHVSAERVGERVCLTIADNGIGIAPEHHERIFRVFERLHGSETYPGTGIGLAIVRRGLERMGGTVEVDSAPGTGSRFRLLLRAAKEA